MAYTLITYYYDEPSIKDEFDNLDDALDAWTDTDWAACHAPRDQVGDVRRITLRGPAGELIRTHAFA